MVDFVIVDDNYKTFSSDYEPNLDKSFNDLYDYVSNSGDFRAGENQSAFYSGHLGNQQIGQNSFGENINYNSQLARDNADKYGHTLIEHTEAGQIIDKQFEQWRLAGKDISEGLENKVWEKASEQYAQQAQGDVVAYNLNAQPDGIYRQTELPNLVENENVSSINGFTRDEINNLPDEVKQDSDKLDAALSGYSYINDNFTTSDQKYEPWRVEYKGEQSESIETVVNENKPLHGEVVTEVVGTEQGFGKEPLYSESEITDVEVIGETKDKQPLYGVKEQEIEVESSVTEEFFSEYENASVLENFSLEYENVSVEDLYSDVNNQASNTQDTTYGY